MTDKEKINKIEFTVDTNESLSNAIRRSVNEVPILAIDEVEFHKNDSALYDEILAHRLGLIPIKTEKSFVESEKCSCKGKGCSKCSVDLKIDLSGPCTVYSKDLKGKAEAPYKEIPIVTLNQDQNLKLIARAKLGRGVEHTKFSPGLMYYGIIPEITIDKNCDHCEECVKACPQAVLKTENKKITVKNIEKCDSCLACVEKCKQHGKDAIKIKNSEKIIFNVESFGQIDAKNIVIEAVKTLKTNLQELKKIK